MPRVVDRVLALVYVAFIALPVIGMVTHARDVPILGVMEPIEWPELKRSSFLDENYQRELTRWFERHVGFRGYAVHADNTAMWHIFRELKLELGIAIGRDDVLFATDDIAHYNRLRRQTRAIDDLAERLASLQAKLKANGQAVVPLIIPSKTSIYPDKITGQWMLDVGHPRPSDEQYLDMKRAFDARGIRYADGHAVLTSPANPRDMLWGVYGRHWSLFGACLSMREVAAQYAASIGKPPFDHPCTLLPLRLPAADPVVDVSGEIDFFRVINAWGARPSFATVPDVGVAPAALGGGRKPTVLFVGTSFMWAAAYAAARSGAFDDIHLFFYNTTQVEWSTQASSKIEPHTDGWRSLVRGKDLIVIDQFEPYIAPDTPVVRFLEQLAMEMDRSSP